MTKLALIAASSSEGRVGVQLSYQVDLPLVRITQLRKVSAGVAGPERPTYTPVVLWIHHIVAHAFVTTRHHTDYAEYLVKHDPDLGKVVCPLATIESVGVLVEGGTDTTIISYGRRNECLGWSGCGSIVRFT